MKHSSWKYVIMHLFAIMVLGCNNEIYFNEKFIETYIAGKVVKDKVIIFDKEFKEKLYYKLSNNKEYKGGTYIYGGLLISGTDYFVNYIDFDEYNIMIVLIKKNDIEIIIDYLILKKQTKDMHFENGAVEINGEYFDWQITIVLRNRWRGKYFDDISEAYIINAKSGKI
jgi:hypothetical protein